MSEMDYQIIETVKKSSDFTTKTSEGVVDWNDVSPGLWRSFNWQRESLLSNIIILKSQQLFLAPYPLWEIGVCYIDGPDYVHSNATIPASFSCSGDFYSCFNIFVMFSDVRVLLRAQINQESGRLTNYYNIVTSSRLIDVHKFVNLNHQWWMFRQK